MYYYRKRWHDGRCVSEYVPGAFAEAAEWLERQERQERQERAAERCGRREADRAVDRAVAGIVVEVLGAVGGYLEATGHHRHKGTWRRRRGAVRGIKGNTTRSGLPNVYGRVLDNTLLEQAAAWWAWAKDGEGEGIDPETCKAIAWDLESYARELAGPGPSPAVAALARTAALAHEATRRYEWRLSQQSSDGLTLAEGSYLQRAIDRAHGRLMKTLRTLAVVRRLESRLPLAAVQVNIDARGREPSAGARPDPFFETHRRPEAEPEAAALEAADA